MDKYNSICLTNMLNIWDGRISFKETIISIFYFEKQGVCRRAGRKHTYLFYSGWRIGQQHTQITEDFPFFT